jgi:hypothetical protein
MIYTVFSRYSTVFTSHWMPKKTPKMYFTSKRRLSEDNFRILGASCRCFLANCYMKTSTVCLQRLVRNFKSVNTTMQTHFFIIFALTEGTDFII